ncbi:hypothetical protein D9M69_613970 [compost metagenome]
MLGTERPAQQHAHPRGHHPAYHQRSKYRPEQLPNPSQVEIKRHRQCDSGRAEQDAENLGALAVLGIGQAAAHQHADHQQHGDQHRLQKDPAGFLECRQDELIGAKSNADTKQGMMNHRRPGAVPVEDHWLSSE